MKSRNFATIFGFYVYRQPFLLVWKQMFLQIVVSVEFVRGQKGLINKQK